MKDINKYTETAYKFLLQEINTSDHDYFLVNFIPDDSVGYYYGTLTKKDVIKAEILFSINGEGEAVSIPSAPFGGIMVHGTLSSEAVSFFIKEIKCSVRQLGIKYLTLIQPPICYCNQSDLIGFLLHTEGFELKKILNHQFFEGKKKLKKISGELMNKSSKKQKEQNLEVTVSNIHNFLFLEEIRHWNQARGYESTVSENRLIQQVSTYPDRYFVISVLQEGKAIGRALAVKLTSNSLYYYLSATDPKVQHKVTGELIMANLFGLAAEQKVDFLDLGSSDMEGKPNHNLIFFKSKYTNNYLNKHFWGIQF